MARRLIPVIGAVVLTIVALVALNPAPDTAKTDPVVNAASGRAITASDVVTITITDDGVDPEMVTATVGTRVVWHNATSEEKTLEVELDAVRDTFLPAIFRDASGAAAQAADSMQSVHLRGSFTVPVPPGGTYSYTYTTVGGFSFSLDLGQLGGSVLVVPSGTQEIFFDRSDGLLTLRVNGVSLLHVLTLLDEGFGLEVVVPDLQDQPVTADFRDVPVDTGLAQILPSGNRFHYVARGTEFETSVSLSGSRGQAVNEPGGAYEKGNQPDPVHEVVKDPKPAPYSPELEGNDLKPPTDTITIPDQPKEEPDPIYELAHGRFNFTISNGDVVPVGGSTRGGGLVRSNRLAGNFIYQVRVDGDPDLVGSMRDPREVAVHGGRGHAHLGLLADEGLFSLPLPYEYVASTDTLSNTEITFYRLQEPLPSNVSTPLPEEISTDNFSTFDPYLSEIDTVTGSELQNALTGSLSLQGVTDHVDVTTLLRSGRPGGKKNLVIVGDGFQAGEQNTFNNFVDTYVMDGVFQNGVLRETMNAFNIYRINLDSTDSGVTQIDSDGDVTTDRDTALDYEYSGDWDRCWMEPGSNTNSALNDVLDHAVPEWDYVFIVLNETGPGGCRRGNTAAVTINDPNDWDVGNHELGHMVGNLGDEYFGSGTYTGGEPSAVNLTKETDRSSIKWNEWIHPSTSLPTECSDVSDNTGDVGLFEGATVGTTKYDEDIYRPSCTGRMRSNSPDHNPVGYTQMQEMVADVHDYSFRNSYVGDFDGDGRDDLVLHYGNTLALYVSTGADLELEWIRTGELAGWDDFKPRDEFFVGDFDGDGRDDLYVFNYGDWAIPYFAMLRSTGSGFELVERFDQKLPGWDDMRYRDEFFVGDYDGDGKDDVAVFNYGDWSVGYFQILRSTGTTLEYVRRYDEELPGWDDMKLRDEFFVGDFDADGRDDVYVFNYGDWSIGYLEMLRSTGSGLSYVERYDEELPGWDDMKQYDRFYVADVDDDGREDLYVFNARDWAVGYLQMLKSNGTGLSNAHRYDDVVPGWDRLLPNDRFYVADVDGDGDDDLYAYNSEDWDSEYLGILESSGTTLSGRWQKDWINSWNLGSYDRFAVANFNGGAGWDDLFVYNDKFDAADWFGLLRSHRSSVGLNAIYREWIHTHNYHRHGWW